MSERTKRCTKCAQEKPLDEFSRDRSQPSGHRSSCKACERERNARYHAENRERRRKYMRDQYYEDLEGRRERRRRWTRENPEKARSMHANWYAKNRDSVVARVHLERARQAGVDILDEVVLPSAVFERYEGLCGICGEQVDPRDFEIDHITPIALGGPHGYANVQLAHRKCNRAKAAKER